MNEPEKQTGVEGIAIAQIWAFAIQLPFRRRIGRNMLGIQAFLALLLVVYWAGLTASPPVAAWAVVYFVSIVLHRIATVRRRGRDDEPHSYYNGWPALARKTSRSVDEFKVKLIAEPVIAVLLAITSAPFGDPAFLFFFGGAVCMFVSTAWTDFQHRKRVDDLRDALLEAKMYRPNNRRRW